jgi:hypothetical protein
MRLSSVTARKSLEQLRSIYKSGRKKPRPQENHINDPSGGNYVPTIRNSTTETHVTPALIGCAAVVPTNPRSDSELAPYLNNPIPRQAKILDRIA